MFYVFTPNSAVVSVLGTEELLVEPVFICRVCLCESLTSAVFAREESSCEGWYGLVVDGTSFALLLDDHIKHDFYNLCRRCWAVVCCRMTPRQKALVSSSIASKENPYCICHGIFS